MALSKILAVLFLYVAGLPIVTAETAIVSQDILASSVRGCGKALPHGHSPGDIFPVTIMSDGVPRRYIIFVPPSYQLEVPAPIILSYHGGGRTAEEQEQLDQLTSPYFNNDSFVVYPQGLHNTWQGFPRHAADDTQFTTDILDHIENHYCVDPTSVSVTGKSDGGGFCNILACDAVLSTRIAAFAPVSGAYYIDTLPCQPSTVTIPCSPGRENVPLLAFHGGNDTTVNFTGGAQRNECLPAISHFIQEWASRDNLGDTNVTTPLANNTVLYSYGTGSDAGMVELVFDSVIGHDWPSTEPNADNERPWHSPASFNATPIILDFFNRNRLSQ